MKSKRVTIILLFAVIILTTLFMALASPGKMTGNYALAAPGDTAVQPQTPDIAGPFVGEPVYPHIFNGDLRDLPQLPDAEPDIPTPLRYLPNQQPKGSAPQLAGWSDAAAQTEMGIGQMPDPIITFAGLDFNGFGAGWPPDTNGDVGPNHYIQTVNTSIGIYNKTTGAQLVGLTLDTFFTGPPGTPCDNNNQGDPVVIYDPMADRWIVTNFAWNNFNTGPYYECIAVSQTADPVSGGWYFYALRADTGGFVGYLNDYPKLGVWPDGWYMTANMFQINPPGPGFGVRVWALDRTSMLAGGALNEVHFDLCTSAECGALLPSNLRGDLPPAGSPNYMIATTPPDLLQLWEFDVDWTTPANSTFTGPVDIPVAPFVIAQSVPQLGTGTVLDSLSFRPMMQAQYRTINGVESLWVNHTVAATDGVGGVRWYEVQDPGNTPTLTQQSTFQPDDHHRWMGSLAADQDGNMAVGYSVSSATMFPAIRYAGRLAGEAPGLLGQGEATLIAGTGSQTGISRWGDYSAMTVDPVDDCTFWYTTEYYITTGNNWQTRIGSFRFPSCGQPKAYLDGVVYNSATQQPIPGVQVTAVSPTMTLTALTDNAGYYTMTLLADTYNLTAGPLLPGYPISHTVSGVSVAVGNTTSTDLYLDPVPYLVGDAEAIDDDVPYGNNNGFLEPGELGVLLWEGLLNTGAITATNVTAELSSSTTGVTVDTAVAPYPDIAAGNVMTNSTAFVISLSPDITCGDDLDFHKVITSSEGVYTADFTLNASVSLPPADVFSNDVEGGAAGWTTGGSFNTWAITTEESHSPTHSWTDSPGGSYVDNTNSYLRTPAYDLSGKRNVVLSGWYMYGLETGYDYVYLEYSLNGGTSWATSDPLYSFNGHQDTWEELVLDASVLDDQANVALRWRMVSDGSVVDDGIHLDDITLSYEPYECTYEALPPDAPTLVAPTDGVTLTETAVTYIWQPALTGGPVDSYELDVNGTVYTFTGAITSTTMILPEGSYNWLVRALNPYGASAWTATWTFTVDLPVVPPTYTIYLPVILKGD